MYSIKMSITKFFESKDVQKDEINPLLDDGKSEEIRKNNFFGCRDICWIFCVFIIVYALLAGRYAYMDAYLNHNHTSY